VDIFKLPGVAGDVGEVGSGEVISKSDKSKNVDVEEDGVIDLDSTVSFVSSV